MIYNYFIQTSKQLCDYLVCDAINTAILTCWQDSRMRKIIEGIGLCVIGGSLIATSGKIKSCMTIKPSHQEPLLTKAIRYGMVGMGLIALCYGVYNIALSTMSTFNALDNVSSSVQSNLVDQFPKNSCQEYLEQAKQTFFSCPEAKEIWQNAAKEKKFSLSCAEPSEAIFGAKFYPDCGEIIIATDSEFGNTLLFELHNLQQLEKIKTLQESMCKFNPNTFAYNIEEIEYSSSIKTQCIADKCFLRGVWPKEFAFSPQVSAIPNNFKEYLETQEIGHTDMIRLEWYKFCDPAQLPTQSLAMDQKYRKILQQIKPVQEALEKLAIKEEIIQPYKLLHKQLERVRSILSNTIPKDIKPQNV